MSSQTSFTKSYDAGTTTTTIFTITDTSATAMNILVKISAVIDDTVNSNNVDASYILTWNGASYSGVTLLSGTMPSSVYGWSVAGSDASFQITPINGAPAGTIAVDVTILPNTGDIQLNY